MKEPKEKIIIKRLLLLLIHSCMSRSKCMERVSKCANKISSVSEVGETGLSLLSHMSRIKAGSSFV